MNVRLQEIRGRITQNVDANSGIGEVLKAYKVAHADRKYLIAEYEKVRLRQVELMKRVEELEKACGEAVKEMEAFDLRQGAWDSCCRAMKAAG